MRLVRMQHVQHACSLMGIVMLNMLARCSAVIRVYSPGCSSDILLLGAVLVMPSTPALKLGIHEFNDGFTNSIQTPLKLKYTVTPSLPSHRSQQG